MSRWILVTDARPTKLELPVLGYDEFYGGIGVVIAGYGDHLQFVHDDDCSITHWMPLPAPPKESECNDIEEDDDESKADWRANRADDDNDYAKEEAYDA